MTPQEMRKMLQETTLPKKNPVNLTIFLDAAQPPKAQCRKLGEVASLFPIKTRQGDCHND